MLKRVLKSIILAALFILVIYPIYSPACAEMYQGKDCPSNEIVIKNAGDGRPLTLAGKTMDVDGKYTFYLYIPPGFEVFRVNVFRLDTGLWILDNGRSCSLIQK
jgi:hypothetical protein